MTSYCIFYDTICDASFIFQNCSKKSIISISWYAHSFDEVSIYDSFMHSTNYALFIYFLGFAQRREFAPLGKNKGAVWPLSWYWLWPKPLKFLASDTLTCAGEDLYCTICLNATVMLHIHSLFLLHLILTIKQLLTNNMSKHNVHIL